MAIEVVKGKSELNRENAEDSVLWALHSALDVVRTLNTEVDDDNNGLDKARDQGMGIFSMLLVFFLFVAAMILLLDTFKFLLIPIWPELENYLVHVFETLNNIYILIQDFVISYK